jgi:hypothetical protein
MQPQHHDHFEAARNTRAAAMRPLHFTTDLTSFIFVLGIVSKIFKPPLGLPAPGNPFCKHLSVASVIIYTD